MTKIVVSKPEFRWLFGGLGFHHSEATMMKMASDEFKYNYLIKTYREISPTYARVFAGYADWTKSAMDSFCEYGEETFAWSDCTVYVVPGRIPHHKTTEEMNDFTDRIAENLKYVIFKKSADYIQQYCITNELSVGNTYAYLSDHLDKFSLYQEQLYEKFRKNNIDVELLATDAAGIGNDPLGGLNKLIPWAVKNIDEITGSYCAHCYTTFGLKFDDPSYYNELCKYFSKAVDSAHSVSKRVILGEYGVHNRGFDSKVMINDVFDGFGDERKERETALATCVQALAAVNSGILSAVYWSFCDYPDPFLGYTGRTKESQDRHETAKFSGFGTSIRYNKNGLFRWSEDGDHSARSLLYSVGLLAKYFKKNSRVMLCKSDDEKIISSSVTNSDESISLCVINLNDKETETNISIDHDIKQDMRVYEYSCDDVPYQPFNDLQPFSYTVSAKKDKAFSVRLKAYSLTLFTTDYTDRKPTPVSNVKAEENTISWDCSKDSEHCYYRIFENGKQIASTVLNTINYNTDKNSKYTVKSVDKYGNC